MEMIHNAVTNQIHGKPVGAAASWTNLASQNSGSITLVKELVRKRQPCEDIDYTVRSGAPVYTEHYHLTSCLQPDGTRKLAWAPVLKGGFCNGPGAETGNPIDPR